MRPRTSFDAPGNGAAQEAFPRAMPRFYFHLHNSLGFVPDEQGQEVSDLPAALSLAVVNIRSIIAEDVRQGRLDLRGRIDIADSSGAVIEVVPFAEAVTIVREGGG